MKTNKRQKTATTKKPLVLKPSKKTMVFVQKALDELEKLMPLGYTHENFCGIARALRTVGPNVSLYELTILKELWRDSYMDSYDSAALQQTVSEIRERF